LNPIVLQKSRNIILNLRIINQKLLVLLINQHLQNSEIIYLTIRRKKLGTAQFLFLSLKIVKKFLKTLSLNNDNNFKYQILNNRLKETQEWECLMTTSIAILYALYLRILSMYIISMYWLQNNFYCGNTWKLSTFMLFIMYTYIIRDELLNFNPVSSSSFCQFSSV